MGDRAAGSMRSSVRTSPRKSDTVEVFWKPREEYRRILHRYLSIENRAIIALSSPKESILEGMIHYHRNPVLETS